MTCTETYDRLNHVTQTTIGRVSSTIYYYRFNANRLQPTSRFHLFAFTQSKPQRKSIGGARCRPQRIYIRCHFIFFSYYNIPVVRIEQKGDPKSYHIVRGLNTNKRKRKQTNTVQERPRLQCTERVLCFPFRCRRCTSYIQRGTSIVYWYRQVHAAQQYLFFICVVLSGPQIPEHTRE